MARAWLRESGINTENTEKIIETTEKAGLQRTLRLTTAQGREDAETAR